jgi:hypothetical protein
VQGCHNPSSCSPPSRPRASSLSRRPSNPVTAATLGGGTTAGIGILVSATARISGSLQPARNPSSVKSVPFSAFSASRPRPACTRTVGLGALTIPDTEYPLPQTLQAHGCRRPVPMPWEKGAGSQKRWAYARQLRPSADTDHLWGQAGAGTSPSVAALPLGRTPPIDTRGVLLHNRDVGAACNPSQKPTGAGIRVADGTGRAISDSPWTEI